MRRVPYQLWVFVPTLAQSYCRGSRQQYTSICFIYHHYMKMQPFLSTDILFFFQSCCCFILILVFILRLCLPNLALHIRKSKHDHNMRMTKRMWCFNQSNPKEKRKLIEFRPTWFLIGIMQIITVRRKCRVSYIPIKFLMTSPSPLDLSVVNLSYHHSPLLVAGSLFLSWNKYQANDENQLPYYAC